MTVVVDIAASTFMGRAGVPSEGRLLSRFERLSVPSTCLQHTTCPCVPPFMGSGGLQIPTKDWPLPALMPS